MPPETTRAQPRDTLFNLPNAISMTRVVFAALFYSASWQQRFVLIVLAGVTDWLDGWIARRQNIASRWGALIDPLSDRLFVFTAICVYLFLGVIASWEYFAFLLRDIMTAVGFLVAKAMPSLRVVDFRARWSGKVVTVLQILVLLVVPLRYFGARDSLPGMTADARAETWIMHHSAIPDWMFIVLGLVSLWSVIDYTVALRRARARARPV
jgi:CDP-diacylglycerol--glycerol-3-phosphate 3-phosphatidyltransferase